MVEIKRITTHDPLYQEERNLRNIVLLRPIGVPDNAWEMHDQKSWHFVAIQDSRVIGCVILLPTDDAGTTAQLMQMAIDTDSQGGGIGRLLVNALIKFAKQEGIKEVTCHSRQNVNAFYLKNGFEVYGESFEEVGIPHNHMRLDIS